MGRTVDAAAAEQNRQNALRQKVIGWRLISILLIMGATLFEIMRGESWLFLLVGQFFASIIWIAMPWLVGRSAARSAFRPDLPV